MDDNDPALRPRLSKIPSAINCEYRKLIIFIPASFASSDLEPLKLLKRPLALRYFVHLVPSIIHRSSMDSGCRENSDVPAVAETCEDQHIFWKRSRRLQRWSLISCADVVTKSCFINEEPPPTAEFVERGGNCWITSEQDINALAYHSLLH